jgi:type I site-specific restriction-modification system R (restriction) subunit
MLLRSHFALLDADQERIDLDLESLDQTLQQVQTHYDNIMQVEDKRVKAKAKKARKQKAKKLGTAQSIEQAATILLAEIKREMSDLARKGTIWLLSCIA